MLLFKIYLAVTLVMSFFTFFVYGWDKRAAQKQANRVPEKTLHLLELFGGWPGAIAGQEIFRHKTQKKMFRAITFSITGLHLVIAGIILWLMFR